MASNQLVILAIAAILLPTIAMATDYVVGDDSGWTINFDYQAWAKDKVFHVGDKLVFKYPVGKHNVHKVNGTVFKDCIVPPENEALTSGKDEIELATPGNKWYICGVANHCLSGQKLSISVVDGAPAPAPGEHNSAPSSGFHVFMAVIVAVVAIAVGYPN
ncbi:hypothetical protein FNV43_RR15351 [Rhamnella rubrinervis]|uniref:Phytocyanin domain-containing protein n=1 Tax=Rhamnella rubrinervis TaxID=2594499 RepID=A0A8K0E1E4_9ROSA|nr:hypothetical protein FNV43_RR15351 [Rhamnella rubrinervis]